MGYSPLGRKESDTTKQLHFHFSNYGGHNEDNGDLLQKIPCMYCYSQYPRPCSRPPWNPYLCRRLLNTHRQVWVSLSWGHCSFLLGPGACKFLFVPFQSLFPLLCKFWQLYSGVNGDLLQEGLCHNQVCSTQSPCPCSRPLLTCTSSGDTQTQFWLSLCGSLGPGVHKVC